MMHERTIVRLSKAGMSIATIASVLEMPEKYVAEMLRRKPEKRNEREAAIAELKAEGYTDEQIAAVFGE